MITKRNIYLRAGLAVLFAVAVSPLIYCRDAGAQAMTLEQVAKQLRNGKVRSTTKVKSIHFGPKYFKPSSNLFKVFQKSRGPDNLLDWVGITTVDFAIMKQDSLRSTEF